MNVRAVLLLLVGVVVGWVGSEGPVANAEPHRTTTQQGFTSGAMRSEKVLREIAVTLRSIDARLARVETTVSRMRTDAVRGNNFGGVHHVQ